MNAALKPPCHHCEKRTPGCHSESCAPWVAYRKAVQAAQDTRKVDATVTGIIIDNTKRTIRKANHKAY